MTESAEMKRLRKDRRLVQIAVVLVVVNLVSAIVRFTERQWVLGACDAGAVIAWGLLIIWMRIWKSSD